MTHTRTKTAMHTRTTPPSIAAFARTALLTLAGAALLAAPAIARPIPGTGPMDWTGAESAPSQRAPVEFGPDDSKALLGSGFLRTASGSGVSVNADDDELDVIIVRRGSSWQELRGRIVSETDAQIVFEVVNLGLRATSTFDRADVIEIRRGTDSSDAGEAGNTEADAIAAEAGLRTTPRDPEPMDDPNTVHVYTIELDGEFGRDITPSPIRRAVQDAKQHLPDVILVVVDNDWSTQGGLQDRGDDWFSGEFDRLFQTEEIMPIFIDEIESEWPRDRQPKLVCWVKTAMGGAGFIPLFFPEIYFHEDGRMGGMGNLLFLFGDMGDEVVREKQFSLRMSAAQGMALRGGYNELIVNAMTRIDEEIAVEFIGGEPHFKQGEAVGDELQLTDNGLNPEKADTPEQRMRAQGNDVLTLRADMALKLNVSQGTTSTFPELWRAMGIDRKVRVIGDDDNDWITDRSDRIMEGWSNGLRNAERTLRDLRQDYAEIAVQGTFRERTAARGAQIANLQRQRRLLSEYGEAIPGSGNALQQIQFQLDVIELDQIGDRP